MLFSTVTSWITSSLAASSSLWHHAKLNAQPEAAAPTVTAAPLNFELRHLHATSADGRLFFHDVQEAGISALALSGEPTSYPLRTQRVTTHRPVSMDAFHNARMHSMRFRESAAIDWDKIEVEGPDVDDRETLLVLAKMTNNAYLLPDQEGWYPLGKYWNDVSSVTLTTQAAVRRRRRLCLSLGPYLTGSMLRASLSAGQTMMTASVVMSLRLPITRRWCSLSRARPRHSSVVVVQHRRTTR